jgi:hypothetical protein
MNRSNIREKVSSIVHRKAIVAGGVVALALALNLPLLPTARSHAIASGGSHIWLHGRHDQRLCELAERQHRGLCGGLPG